MNIIEYADYLDAQRAIRAAERHGSSDSLMAYKDRLEAEKAKKYIRRIETQDAARRERYGPERSR